GGANAWFAVAYAGHVAGAHAGLEPATVSAGDVTVARARRGPARTHPGNAAGAGRLRRIRSADLRIGDVLSKLRDGGPRLRPGGAGDIAPKHVLVLVEVLLIFRA